MIKFRAPIDNISIKKYFDKEFKVAFIKSLKTCFLIHNYLEMSNNIKREELLNTFFAQRKFHLLLEPKEDICVGNVYEQANDDMEIYRTHTLNSIVKPLGAIRKEFKLPEPERDVESVNIIGKFSDFRNRGLVVGFFTDFFNKIKPGLGLNIFARFSQRNVQDIIFSFLHHTVDSLLIGSINSSLRDFTIDYDIADSQKRYWVVTQVHRCRGLSIGIAGGTDRDNQFILDAANTVNFQAGSSSSSQGVSFVNLPTGEKKIAFGVVLGELKENRVMPPLDGRGFDPLLPPASVSPSSNDQVEAVIQDSNINDNEFLKLT